MSLPIRSATYSVFPARSSTTLDGSNPAAHVACTRPDSVSMTVTVSSQEFATKSLPPSGETENPRGTCPTGIVRTTPPWPRSAPAPHPPPGTTRRAATHPATTAIPGATHTAPPRLATAAHTPSSGPGCQAIPDTIPLRRLRQVSRRRHCGSSTVSTRSTLRFSSVCSRPLGQCTTILSDLRRRAQAKMQPPIVLRQIPRSSHAFRHLFVLPAVHTSTRAPIPSRLLRVFLSSPCSLIAIQCPVQLDTLCNSVPFAPRFTTNASTLPSLS